MPIVTFTCLQLFPCKHDKRVCVLRCDLIGGITKAGADNGAFNIIRTVIRESGPLFPTVSAVNAVRAGKSLAEDRRRKSLQYILIF